MRIIASRSCAFALAIVAAGCNSRTPPTAPTPPPLPPAIASIELDPRAVIGGRTTQGTVLLSSPAPASGVTVTLSASDAPVLVPGAATVPPGAAATNFVVTTQPVASDVAVMIRGATPGQSVEATLAVWTAALPNFVSFTGDRFDFISRGEIWRFTDANAQLPALCTGSLLRVAVFTGDDIWFLNFGAAGGAPLRVGSYENARSDLGVIAALGPTPEPFIEINASGRTCATAGRFTVHDVEVTRTGDVRRFWATFEQRCQTQPGALRGDVRITNAPRPNGTLQCTVD